MEVPVKPWSPLAPPKAGKPRRPPSLPLVCEVFPDHSSFSVLRETPMAFFCDYFKKLNCYRVFKILSEHNFLVSALSLGL
jgi:hypothetical protein